MATKEDLQEWLKDTLKKLDGRGSIVQICKYVWDKYENDLRMSGDLFYTWQYDIRWAATQLRKSGVMRPANVSPSGIWELTQRP